MAAVEQKQVTVPDYIDEAAKSAASETCAIVPRSPTGLDQGWHYFNYTDLANAMNSMAWWIEKTIGVAQQPGQTIGYMGYADDHSKHMQG